MKNAIMFGAGNVGRGFLGQLFAESGYRVVFVDIVEPLLEALNAQGSYTLRLVGTDSEEELEIGPVAALHSIEQADEVKEAIAEADIMATAVGVRVLPAIAPLIAAGLARRAQLGRPPLNTIICENLKDAADIFRDMVEHNIDPDDESAQRYIAENAGFVNTVIGRMVPPIPEEVAAKAPSFIMAEPYKELPVDKAGFKGEVPEIVAMEPIENFEAYTARKLYIHNCGHAVLAYLGHLKDYVYGYEALADDEIAAWLDRAWDESIAGIVNRYEVGREWLEAHADDLRGRFANKSLGDTVARLGRDPIRKLGPTDRLVGAAFLARDAGVEVEALALAIASAFLFDEANDESAQKLQGRIFEHSQPALMAEICQIDPASALGQRVTAFYENLSETGAVPSP